MSPHHGWSGRPVLEREFWNLPFEAYAPVRRQFVTMFKRSKRAAAYCRARTAELLLPPPSAAHSEAV